MAEKKKKVKETLDALQEEVPAERVRAMEEMDGTVQKFIKAGFPVYHDEENQEKVGDTSRLHPDRLEERRKRNLRR